MIGRLYGYTVNGPSISFLPQGVEFFFFLSLLHLNESLKCDTYTPYQIYVGGENHVNISTITGLVSHSFLVRCDLLSLFTSNASKQLDTGAG